MTSSPARSPLRRLLLLGSLAASLLAVAAPISSAAVSFELSGTKRGGKCRSSLPLSDASWSLSCVTKDLRVVVPGGKIRYAYAVTSVGGCSTMDMIVRTTGRTPAQGSFTALRAAADETKRGNLTTSLSTISATAFAPARGTVVKLSIEMPYDGCPDLTAFEATVRFPTLKKAR